MDKGQKPGVITNNPSRLLSVLECVRKMRFSFLCRLGRSDLVSYRNPDDFM